MRQIAISDKLRSWREGSFLLISISVPNHTQVIRFYVRSVLYEEFIDGRKRRGLRNVVFHRRSNIWREYELPDGGFPKLRGSCQAKKRKVHRFTREVLPGRILGNCAVIICGESNGVPYHQNTGKVGDDFGLRRSLPKVTLPSGVTSTGQASTDFQIILTGVNVAFSARIGSNNVTVTANGTPSDLASLGINGPNQMVLTQPLTAMAHSIPTAVVTSPTKGIRSAAITLRRAENPASFMTASAAEGRFLIPPLTEVLIEITAQGYKPWPPSDRATTEGRILLKPEESLKLQVSLTRDETGSTSQRK